MSFNFLDVIVVSVYLLIIFYIGLRQTYSQKNSSEYFLGGKSFNWLVVGLSLFATNISSEHIVGMAATGFIGGVGTLNFELIGGLSCVALAWTFGRFYIRNHVFTLPEYIEKRFNYFCRFYLSIGSIFAYILTKISILLLAGAIFLEKIAGIDVYTSSICLVLITGIYTVSGGFGSVIHTTYIQAIILIVGGIVILLGALLKIGDINLIINHIPNNQQHLMQSFGSSDFPWTGVAFGIPLLTIWYHCTDQFMVQKFLVSKDLPNAQAGTVASAYFKLLPFFLFLVPGVIAHILYPTINPEDAYATLIMDVLPAGLRGLVVAGFLAALMSSLSSAFASCSTLFTLDIYKKMYPDANDFMIVNVGRIMTFVIVILAIIWVVYIKSISGSLYMFLQSITAYIAPPITAVFIMAIYWSRANEKGATTTLISGFLLGMSRFIIEILIHKKIILHGFLYEFGSIHFLHFAILLFLFSLVAGVVVSLFTNAPSKSEIEGLTFKYAHMGNADLKVESEGSGKLKKAAIYFSYLYLAIVLAIYLYSQTR
jgi:SSS family solute:Na+ symporter